MENKVTWKKLVDNVIASPSPTCDMEIPLGVSQYGTTISDDSDKNVLIVGSSGSGKSTLVNQIINIVALLRHPKYVRLWLSDCKGYEFKQYMPNSDGIYLPHIDVCASTCDPSYHLSLLNELRRVASERYKTIERAGCKDWREYNEKISSGDIMPNIYYFCDEFQALMKVYDIHNTLNYILSLSRIVGIRLFFSSQSSLNALSNDEITQFGLRIALRCEASTCARVMCGNTDAAKFDKPYGSALCFEPCTIVTPTKISVPFISNKDIEDNITEQYKKCEEHYKKELTRSRVFFTPDMDSSIEGFMDSFESKYKDIEIPTSTLFLGKNLFFSRSKADTNIVFSNRADMHLIGCFAENEDMAAFLNTVVSNEKLQSSMDVTIMCTKESGSFLESMNYMLDKAILNSANYYVGADGLFAKFESLIRYRSDETSSGNKHKFIILTGCESLLNPMNIKAFKNYLYSLGELGIHVLFVTNTTKCIDKLDIANSFLYRICGSCSKQDSVYLLGNTDASREYQDSTQWAILSFNGTLQRYKYFLRDKEQHVETVYQLEF